MTAWEYISKRVKEPYQEKATVIAHIDPDEWFHVHWEEEIPCNYPVSIKIR